MKHLILGTAGHIDHGKTSLVKALTGIDTDRLKEEKARGITIELGFAHLELPGDIQFGIVDVPGHEKFVRAMVAGVGGMDLVMLTIAADEGIMPQTREHLDIIRLLGIKKGLIALTKQDRVEQEWLELVTEEIRDFVSGSFLESAPVIPVSSRTGFGIDSLKQELSRLAAEVHEKRHEGHFRLPVDRVFTMAGFGTIVTGTLLSGEIKTGDEIELLPSGEEGKVRGIQAHGVKREVGLAGQRLAVNLQGIDLHKAHRGDVLVPRGIFQAGRTVDVRLDYLHSAPKELKHRATLRLHSATYEVPAQVIMLDRDTMQPGESAYVQLRLQQPALLLSGDSYILRMSTPATTVGGGSVLDPFPPRRRRRSAEALQLLEAFGSDDHKQIIALIISQSMLSGVSYDDLLLRSGMARKPLDSVLTALLSSGDVMQVVREPRIFLAREAFEALKKLLISELLDFLESNRNKDGMGKEELKTRIPKRSDIRFFTPLLMALEKEGVIQQDRELVKPAGNLVPKGNVDNSMPAKLAAFLEAGGKEPPTVKEIMDHFGCDEKNTRDNLTILVRNGMAARISSDLFFATKPLNSLRELLVQHLSAHGEITAPEYRDLTGLSRKFLIPLLEYFDSEKVTIRVGDKRVARKR